MDLFDYLILAIVAICTVDYLEFEQAKQTRTIIQAVVADGGCASKLDMTSVQQTNQLKYNLKEI